MQKSKPIKVNESFNDDFLSILNKLIIPCFTQKDTPFSPRMLNYYNSKQLLLFATEKGKKRNFSAEQLFWIYILNDTAKVGYSLLQELFDIKYRFENITIVDGEYRNFNYLQYMLGSIIYSRYSYHLKINEEGSYSFFTYQNLQRVLEGDFMLDSSHIDIALWPIAHKIWKMLTKEDLQLKRPSLSTMTYSNKEIIQAIEKGNFEKLEIKKDKNGKLLVSTISREDIQNLEGLVRLLFKATHSDVSIHFGEDPGKPIATTVSKKKKQS